MITPEEQEERIREVIAEVAKIQDHRLINESVVWDALRAAYQRGYHDGLGVRADPESEEAP